MAWRAATHAAVCDRVEPWDHGVAVRCTDAPTYYDFNSVRVDGGDPGLAATKLMAVADVLQTGLEHRKLEVEDAAAGERWRPELEAAGWHTGRLLWMVHSGEAPAVPGEVRLEVVPDETIRPLRLSWTDPPFTREDVERFLPVEETVGRRLNARNLAVIEDGEPIAFARTTSHNGSVEVNNVFVRADRRGGGLGGALTSWAVTDALAAGAEHVLIIADDEGRPKHLYERLGFCPAWVQHEFTRLPSTG